MKKITLVGITTFSLHICTSQSLSTKYFGQQPPAETPQLFAPGFISKEGRYELMAAYAPDGREFCFTITNEQWSHFEIWHTLFDGRKWTEAQRIPLSFSMECFGPAFSPDNNRMFFSSANWVTHPSTIWYITRRKTDHNEVHKSDSIVNVGSDQWQCSLAGDGALVFASKREGGKGDYDLYLSEPDGDHYDKVTNLSELNSPADEYSAFIAPNKSYIIFSSQRKGGYGWDDLYISFRKKDGRWTDPVNLGPDINTIHAEFSPQVTQDGRYLIYSKWDKKNQWSDIYWVRIDKIIHRLKKRSFQKKLAPAAGLTSQ